VTDTSVRPVSQRPADPERRPDAAVRSSAAARGPIGLTSAGVAVISLGLSSLLALVDGMISPGLGGLFATGFVAASVYTALEVRRTDFLAAIITPPITFLFVGFMRTLVVPPSEDSGMTRRGLDLLVWLAEKAPLLYLATGLAAAVVGYRYLRSRSLIH
jgi:hypothetical protein